MMLHKPVLLEETLSQLSLDSDEIVLDGTIGYGGHAQGVLDQLTGRSQLIGLDQDPVAIAHCESRFKGVSQVQLFCLNYSQFLLALEKSGVSSFTKGILDLGLSSVQLDLSGRGFSHQKSEPLDMRMSPLETEKTAADILNTYDADSLITLFTTYSELRNVQRFVELICHKRSEALLETTEDLLFCIKKGFYFRNNRKLFMRTCSQVFQGLRIEVNEELAHLELFLNSLQDALAVGGRMAIISFHSLEDRIVKSFVKENAWLSPINKFVLVIKIRVRILEQDLQS